MNPLTRKRIRRFKSIRRGYWALLILLFFFIVSLLSNYIANNRPIYVRYEGRSYFPTFHFYPMSLFGQEDEYGFDDGEADYRALRETFKGTSNRIIMPIVPFNPFENDFQFYDGPPPHPPDRRHWLGTDSQARDVFARLLYGLRVSLLFAFALVLVSQTFGAVVGCLQGYMAGRFDLYTQRIIEIWSTLPFLYIIIIMATFFTPGFWLLLFIMTLFQWKGITYYMRTEMYREKTRQYCLAAQSYGASHARIVFRHLLPNCLTPLITLTPFAVVMAISSLTALDYLGYGLPAPTPSWGEMIDQALEISNRDKIWLTIAPFTAISVTLILVTLIGEAVREAFDPRQYVRYE